MKSSGGVAPAPEAAASGAQTVLVGARRRRRRGGPAGHALGRRRRPRLRHGWDFLRRLRGRGRRRPPHRLAPDLRPRDPAADGGRPHRRRRRWLDRLGGRRRGAPSRPPIGRCGAGAGVLRTRRHQADCHRRQPAAGVFGRQLGARRRGRRSIPTPPGRRSVPWGRAWAWTSWRRRRASSASPTRRWCVRCGWSRSSGVSTRAASP